MRGEGVDLRGARRARGARAERGVLRRRAQSGRREHARTVLRLTPTARAMARRERPSARASRSGGPAPRDVRHAAVMRRPLWPRAVADHRRRARAAPAQGDRAPRAGARRQPGVSASSGVASKRVSSRAATRRTVRCPRPSVRLVAPRAWGARSGLVPREASSRRAISCGAGGVVVAVEQLRTTSSVCRTVRPRRATTGSRPSGCHVATGSRPPPRAERAAEPDVGLHRRLEGLDEHQAPAHPALVAASAARSRAARPSSR